LRLERLDIRRPAGAIGVALWLPRGLWGLVADRLQLRLFPTGYWQWPAVEPARRDAAPARL
jgi:hypothetical protein